MSSPVINNEKTVQESDAEFRGRLLPRIEELSDMLAANAVIGDEQRKVPEESIRALRDAGACRLTRPREYGGAESSARTMYEVHAAIGRYCPSSAWIAGLYNASAWAVSHFDPQAVTDVFGQNPDSQFSGSITVAGSAVPVEGGYRVSGSWPYQSGSFYAEWAMMGTKITNEHDEVVDQIFALIPRSELSWEDSWHVAGMRGTGSNTLIAEDVFVPTARTMSLPATLGHKFPQDLSSNGHFNMPLIPLFNLLLVAPQVGMARGALDSVIKSLGRNRSISFSFYKVAAEAPTTQFQLGEAASLIDAADALMMAAASALDQAGASGEFMAFDERMRVKMQIDRAMEMARDAVNHLLNIGGASSFATANRLQMYWRDIETASRHAFLAPAIARENYGRVLLGISAPSTPFI